MPFTLNKILFLLLFTCLIGSNLLAQDMSQMKQYYFVLLSKGPNRTQDSATEARIQKAHLENMGKLAAEGKLQVAGPFTDDGNFRGIFIFDAGSKEEVERWVQTDEAIKSGRLSYEIHPWMTQKGNCFK